MADEPINEGPDTPEESGPVHLHKNYSTAYCGEDAAHTSMTYTLAETTCTKCLDALATAREQREKLDADATDLNKKVEATNDQFNKDIKRRHEQHAEDLGKLGETATDLTERRGAFNREFTHLPEQPE